MKKVIVRDAVLIIIIVVVGVLYLENFSPVSGLFERYCTDGNYTSCPFGCKQQKAFCISGTPGGLTPDCMGGMGDNMCVPFYAKDPLNK